MGDFNSFKTNNLKTPSPNITSNTSQRKNKNSLTNNSFYTTQPKNDQITSNFPFNKSNKYTNVFIICGAGISTNAGIPDFRSKNSFNTFLKKFKYTNLSFFSEITAQTNIINTEVLKNLRLCYRNKQIIFIDKWDSIIYKVSYENFLSDLYFLVYICRISRSLRKELDKNLKQEIFRVKENYNEHLNEIIPTKRKKYLFLLAYFILGTFKKPTKTHELMKFLINESITKIFTQNVDLLEQYCVPDNNNTLSFYNTNIVDNKIQKKK